MEVVVLYGEDSLREEPIKDKASREDVNLSSDARVTKNLGDADERHGGDEVIEGKVREDGLADKRGERGAPYDLNQLLKVVSENCERGNWVLSEVVRFMDVPSVKAKQRDGADLVGSAVVSVEEEVCYVCWAGSATCRYRKWTSDGHTEGEAESKKFDGE